RRIDCIRTISCEFEERIFEGSCFGGFCALGELLGCVFSHETAIVQNPDGVGDFFDDRKNMRREEYGGSSVGKIANHFAECTSSTWIKSRGRLIKEDDVRFV